MKYTKILIAAFLLCFAQTAFSQVPADALIEKAQEKARKENKNVMVFFHASWCSWCKLMEKKMQQDNIKKIFEENFVFVPIDVQEKGEKKKLETPGGNELMAKYGGAKAGLPFFLFMNADGEVIENSLNEKNENLGCPSTKEEVSSFITKLKKSSKISDEQLGKIGEVFMDK